MKDSSKYNFKIINEFKNDLNAEDIKIHIYTLQIKDMDAKHSENSRITWALKRLNKENKNIIFFKNFIASFDSIDIWKDESDNYEYINHEYKNINPNNPSEKTLLERLILNDIKTSSWKCGYRCNKDGIFTKQPIYQDKDILAYRRFFFDVTVEKNGDIIIGYNSSISFDYIRTLDDDIRDNTIKPGDIVKDYHKGGTYRFVSVADFTISDENKYMCNSIVDYYSSKNESYIVENLDPQMKAVLVDGGKDGKVNIFPYIPSRLKKLLTYDKLPYNAIKITKLNPTDRMNILVQAVKNISPHCRYVKYKPQNRIIDIIGYREVVLEKPLLKFNNNMVSNSITSGLFNYGTYESKPVDISYFIDPAILKDQETFGEVLSFTKELEQRSSTAKVNLIRTKSGVRFKDINIDNHDVFEMELRNIVSNYKGASIFIMTDENGEKYYNSVKKVFGNKNSIPTQFIYVSTIKNANKEDREHIRRMVYANILLGIYGKSGVQPFVLKNELTADCYVGLDVSRENGVNTAGVIQVIGKDGRIIKSKIINSSQRGEKIKIETIKEILLDAVSTYKKEYGVDLKHMVFHRDGLNREDLDTLQETAKNLGIKFDYVEIVKKVQRRIAKTDMSKLKHLQDGNVDVKSLKLKTELGGCYIKGDMAYMITTDPRDNTGMAQPIRVNKVFGDSSIEDIAKDVYDLSYMHIGSINKARLPVTTYYADLSSTYGNRGLIPSEMDGEELHFI